MDGSLRERKEMPRFTGAGLDKMPPEKGMETDG
jgi:hypothetical protein